MPNSKIAYLYKVDHDEIVYLDTTYNMNKEAMLGWIEDNGVSLYSLDDRDKVLCIEEDDPTSPYSVIVTMQGLTARFA